MTSAAVKSPPAARRRWWGLVALIFIVQLGLIGWLSNSAPLATSPAPRPLTFTLAGSGSDELLEVQDPTLFALPHLRESDEVLISRSPPRRPFAFDWPEPTNLLSRAADHLGCPFNEFIRTNQFSPPQLADDLKPALTLPNLPIPTPSVEASRLRLEGDLVQSRLLTPVPLPSWVNAEILGETVVRMAVNADGRPVSLVLLSSSGWPEADRYALQQSKAARFEPHRGKPSDPAPDAAAGLAWGRMVFQWHTLPPPATNVSAATP